MSDINKKNTFRFVEFFYFFIIKLNFILTKLCFNVSYLTFFISRSILVKYLFFLILFFALSFTLIFHKMLLFIIFKDYNFYLLILSIVIVLLILICLLFTYKIWHLRNHNFMLLFFLLFSFLLNF